ncbi:hypothetical protein KXV38_000535 [Aspergillus fumigatus]|nr:hypothetical protein KXV38_000535 [Aspergillus fumigatus]
MGDNERSGTDDRDEVQRRLDRFSDPQSVDEYCDLLQKEILVLPVLSHDPRVLESAGSVIWHTDLHLGNIYVSSDDPTTIEGFPEFLRPPKNYSTGTEIPSLPENFEELDPDQKERVAEEQTLAAQSKYYEMSCLAYNKPIYDAMKLDRRLWEPFTCCQLFSNGSMVPLRNSLARLFQDWANIGLPGSCPFEFTEDDLRRHNEQVQHYQDTVYLKAGGNNFTTVTFQESDGRAAHQIEASTVERDTYLLVWCWMMIERVGRLCSPG